MICEGILKYSTTVRHYRSTQEQKRFRALLQQTRLNNFIRTAVNRSSFRPGITCKVFSGKQGLRARVNSGAGSF